MKTVGPVYTADNYFKNKYLILTFIFVWKCFNFLSLLDQFRTVMTTGNKRNEIWQFFTNTKTASNPLCFIFLLMMSVTGFKAFITTLLAAIRIDFPFYPPLTSLDFKKTKYEYFSFFKKNKKTKKTSKVRSLLLGSWFFWHRLLSHKQRGRKKVFHLESSYVWSCLLCVGSWQLRLT